MNKFGCLIRLVSFFFTAIHWVNFILLVGPSEAGVGEKKGTMEAARPSNGPDPYGTIILHPSKRRFWLMYFLLLFLNCSHLVYHFSIQLFHNSLFWFVSLYFPLQSAVLPHAQPLQLKTLLQVHECFLWSNIADCWNPVKLFSFVFA